MKKSLQITIAAVATAAIFGCGADGPHGIRYTVSGADAALADGTRVFLRSKVCAPGADFGYTWSMQDSTTVQDGAFAFEGETNVPTDMYIFIDNPKFEYPIQYSMFFAEEGGIKIVDGEMSGVKRAAGTPLNERFAEISEELDPMALEMQRRMVDGDMAGFMSLSNRMDSLTDAVIEANVDNAIGAYLLKERIGMLDADAAVSAIGRLPEPYQAWFEPLMAIYRKFIGEPYIDITEPAVDGSETSLRSVVEAEGNRYVFVDFWASWCVPCMGEMPYLKEAYGKYGDRGLEIYGISLDSDRDAWLKAIDDNSLDWIHVSELKGGDTDACRSYGITAIPANFLIDCSTGKIVAKSLRGEQLQAKMAELFD